MMVVLSCRQTVFSQLFWVQINVSFKSASTGMHSVKIMKDDHSCPRQSVQSDLISSAVLRRCTLPQGCR
jgi:hypothetical protein